MKTTMFTKITIRFFMLALLAFSINQASADDALRTGEFVGKSDHITTGGVTVHKISNGFIVKLAADFSLDGAPEPSVGFGNDGNYDPASDLGDLVKISGASTYLLPPEVDYSQYNEIYIWCDKFNVPLGVATLN